MKIDGRDALAGGMPELPLRTPDAARAERTRARCHAILARRQRPVRQTAIAKTPADRLVGPLLIGTVSLLYLLAVLQQAVRFLVTPL